jgi:hypothetical protein
MASNLASIYGRHRRPADLPFKCETCGTKNCDVTLEEWADDRLHEITVCDRSKLEFPGS